MKIAIVGASGKTGIRLVDMSLDRGHEVVAVCRESSAARLEPLAGRAGCTVMTAPVVSDEATLTRALAGCDGVVAVLIAVRRLRATGLVASLARATAANGVRRLVFTAGEITAVREAGEVFTLRQRLMSAILPGLLSLSPFSLKDMLRASALIHEQPDWDWTIVRAPTLTDAAPAGYRFCDISDVTAAHALSRADYAACMLDSLTNPDHHRRTLAVVSASST